MANISRGTYVPCDLDTLKGSWHCLNCLSETQLMMVILITMNFIYNYLNNDNITPTERLQEMGCLNCLSNKQLLQGIAGKLVTTATELGYEMEAGLADAACAQCSDPKLLKVANAALFCGLVGVQITPQN